MGRVRRVLAMGPAAYVDLVILSALGIAAEIGVRAFPLPRIAPRFGVRLTGPRPTVPGPPLTAKHRRRHRIVGMMIRHWPLLDESALCLRRALLDGWVFRDRDPLLRIGVARTADGVTAHAWIEFDRGQVGFDGIHRPLTFPQPEAPTSG